MYLYIMLARDFLLQLLCPNRKRAGGFLIYATMILLAMHPRGVFQPKRRLYQKLLAQPVPQNTRIPHRITYRVHSRDEVLATIDMPSIGLWIIFL